jgi:EF hand
MILMNKFALLGSGIAVVLAASAFAADPASPKMAKGPMTKADVMAYSDARFAKMDSNGDGKLDAADHGPANDAQHGPKHGPEHGPEHGSDAEHKKSNDEHFSAMDSDKNGVISRAEFDAAHAPGKGMAEHRGKGGKGCKGGERGAGMHDRMMKNADTNNDMSVSRDEFRAVAEARFVKQDANKDGVISAEESKQSRGKMKRRGGANAPAEPMPTV